MLPKKRPPTHPGEMLLKEFLEPAGITQTQFSQHIGWTYARLNEIINGKRGVSADSALTLSEALGNTPQFWLNLQRNWELWHALQTHKEVKPLLLKAS
ncbi:MAG: HigA family addiction module antidote protein [gamma proteobacterium symbiont of Bathyaustriella thionipta]|nr:HigA family addiction module antidote protein [gamma proteobacterium symbiont of Bathyaustriella thionipta]MCU7951398.1 HigA family addiction module antidote protein [gamma proteobacterium symbiont of Bathyaustriella thionipta]MCU7954571.1 HigA family addiction module antidote protein [gamma proteobacterium symbiont of Bathyaustriella thionipta]MCU7957951.1 HigA family addiction module antidote protein [gamma proteobacterium symbiont of Bathyaustriella thionipta]MCU7966002.1 HigA family addi